MTTEIKTTTENTQSFDNLRNIKSTKAKATKLSQLIRSAKLQLDEIDVSISMKKNEFAKSVNDAIFSQEQQIIEEVVPQVISEAKQQVEVKPTEPKANNEVEATPESVEVKPQVNKDSKPIEVKEKVEPIKPTEVSQKVEPKKEKRISQNSNATSSAAQPTLANPNISTKTNTDEKGNVTVRRFLQPTPPPTYPKKPANVGERYPRNPNASTTRPPYNNNTSNGAKAPFGGKFIQNKDQDTSATRPIVKKPLHPTTAPIVNTGVAKTFGNKNKTHDKPDDKKQINKRTLVTRTYSPEDEEGRIRSKPRGKKQQIIIAPMKKIDKAIISTQDVPIKVLSDKIGKPATEIIKQLFKEGILKNINDSVDFEYAAYIANGFGVELELKLDKTAEEMMTDNGFEDNLPDNAKRPPIVTVMGHVDHGKTSLLDAIRKTKVATGEAGGITQHIGAYIASINGEQITFIDTPGHAAFTKMRARGAQVTDVAIIVVAADDGVMPQTIEAISHAKAAGVSIIVAINKVDKPEANIERIKQQLTEFNLVTEEWGGDTIMVPVSAKTGQGIDELLEAILTVAEVKELRANPDKKGAGTVIESRLDKGRGVVATVLVSNGTLRVGDYVIAGTATGKIRAMTDDKGRKITKALPSWPAEVVGFSEVPNAGDFLYVADEKLIRKVADERTTKIREESKTSTAPVTLDDFFGKIDQDNMKVLNLIIKTDVQGSLDAIKMALSKVGNEEVRVESIHGGVGAINETDVSLAKSSNAIIIGFNVRADNAAKISAEAEHVDIRLYRIIYDAVNDIDAAIHGMLSPKFKEVVIGSASVRKIYKASSVGTIAGCYVTNGKITRIAKVRLYRNDVLIFEGVIDTLKRFKDDVKEVASDYECGITIENYNDIKEDDVIEAYIIEQIKQ
ncbi:MAG: translation initiation factor IF-2 [Clostridia bacterium]